MKVEIKKGTAYGYIDAPPSKSMAHRLLICAGLSGGVCRVHGIAASEDVLATIDCLKALGTECEFEFEAASDTERGAGTVMVKGMNPKFSLPQTLNCRESGSTLRFFVPICLLSGNEITLTGAPRLLERPQGVYRDICDKQGMTFVQDEDGITVKGPLKAGIYELPGDVSSQFISGLLFALPLVDGDSSIKIITPIESKSYIDMTIDSLATFGVEAMWQGEDEIYIKGNQKYRLADSHTNDFADERTAKEQSGSKNADCTKEVFVEGDYSNAAFFEALNLIGGKVKIGNLKEDSIQGDRVFREMFEKLSESKPTLDISDCPDLGPILMAAAAAKNGATLTGTKRLKIKESDRGQAMAKELAKFGVETRIYEDEIVVEPRALQTPAEAIDGHNDHRIVMSNAVLLTLTGGIIDGAEAVSKSFPDFFERLSELGIEVKRIDN